MSTSGQSLGERLGEAVTIRQLLERNTEETRGVLRALNGEYILPEAGGDLLRDGAGVLPTGALPELSGKPPLQSISTFHLKCQRHLFLRCSATLRSWSLRFAVAHGLLRRCSPLQAVTSMRWTPTGCPERPRCSGAQQSLRPSWTPTAQPTPVPGRRRCR